MKTPNPSSVPFVDDEAGLTARQCRVARDLLDWTPEELARRSGTSVQAISGFERLERPFPLPDALAVARTLKRAGVEFAANGHPRLALFSEGAQG
ncbi:helix-turn-helix domain-containing protein [Azospirillum doebereinerae]|uniref:helix-turn-helix domain-containing protein n=1 Tax=Azospirillum doebereinerae TaxID=92933 RepID=UPI00163C38CE|nr:helix-turn-helix transcriptional regulator [Azospirillum doebereinerae]